MYEQWKINTVNQLRIKMYELGFVPDCVEQTCDLLTHILDEAQYILNALEVEQ